MFCQINRQFTELSKLEITQVRSLYWKLQIDESSVKRETGYWFVIQKSSFSHISPNNSIMGWPRTTFDVFILKRTISLQRKHKVKYARPNLSPPDFVSLKCPLCLIQSLKHVLYKQFPSPQLKKSTCLISVPKCPCPSKAPFWTRLSLSGECSLEDLPQTSAYIYFKAFPFTGSQRQCCLPLLWTSPFPLTCRSAPTPYCLSKSF